jgi:hypothetical protein
VADSKLTVYVETTIPSYLTAWPTRVPARAREQQLTRQWWDASRGRYDLYLSELVAAEIRMGDPSAARDRLEAVRDLPQVVTTTAARELAREYVNLLAIPPRALADGLHLALTVVNELDYLLTWNCRHLANPHVIRAIAIENTRRGLHVPLIVTPENLLDLEANP